MTIKYMFPVYIKLDFFSFRKTSFEGWSKKNWQLATAVNKRKSFSMSKKSLPNFFFKLTKMLPIDHTIFFVKLET
jgi:hypothetical protein